MFRYIVVLILSDERISYPAVVAMIGRETKRNIKSERSLVLSADQGEGR